MHIDKKVAIRLLNPFFFIANWNEDIRKIKLASVVELRTIMYFCVILTLNKRPIHQHNKATDAYFYVLTTQYYNGKWFHFINWNSVHILFGANKNKKTHDFVKKKLNISFDLSNLNIPFIHWICNEKTIVLFHFLHFCLSKWLSIIQKRNQAKWTLITILHFIVWSRSGSVVGAKIAYIICIFFIHLFEMPIHSLYRMKN